MLEKKRLSVQPTFHNTRFFFAFSIRTQLWLPMFERKWENSFGKIGKKEFEGKGIQGKITKYPVAPSEIRTHDLRVTREKPQTILPLSHLGRMSRNKKSSMYVLDAATSSGILKAKQKLGVTFNSDKLGGIDFTKFSKLSMCSAGAGRCWLVQWPGLPPRHCTWSVLKFL